MTSSCAEDFFLQLAREVVKLARIKFLEVMT